MDSIFNEKMTSIEARMALYENCEGKTKEEKNKLFEEYIAILPKIIKRETEEGANL